MTDLEPHESAHDWAQLKKDLKAAKLKAGGYMSAYESLQGTCYDITVEMDKLRNDPVLGPVARMLGARLEHAIETAELTL